MSVCIPEARDLNNGTLQVLPRARGPVRGLDRGGSVMRVFYTASVPQTSLSCSGSADLCFNRQGDASKCMPFNATGVSRSVLNCV